jgi:hypothetical protein
MKVRIGLVLGVAVALAAPALAQAVSLPQAKSTLIVPARSLAGVKLNSSIAAAVSAWGKGGSCTPAGCEYGTPSSSLGTANFIAGKRSETGPVLVIDISITVGRTGTSLKPNFRTPLARYTTASGIGLGSTVKELKHAYPHVVTEQGKVFLLKGAGESMTTFIAENGRVETITTQSVHLG